MDVSCELLGESRLIYRECTLMDLSVHLSIHLSIKLFWFMGISGQTAQGIDLRLGRYIHYSTPHIWLTFDPALRNFCHFQATESSSCFWKFIEKTVIGLSWNLVGKLIMCFPDQIKLKFGGLTHYELCMDVSSVCMFVCFFMSGNNLLKVMLLDGGD